MELIQIFQTHNMKIEVEITNSRGKVKKHAVSNSDLLNDEKLKQLIWKECEITEEDTRQKFFKYMKSMQSDLIKS